MIDTSRHLLTILQQQRGYCKVHESSKILELPMKGKGEKELPASNPVPMARMGLGTVFEWFQRHNRV